MSNLGRLIAVFSGCMLLLAGCATQTPSSSEGATESEFSRVGRFALRAEGPNQAPEAVQGGFVWRDTSKRLTLDLSNPFGTILARVVVEPSQATLTQANGEILRAANPDDLVQKALGQRVPVRELGQWLRASLRALPSMQRVNRDAQGRITSFEQDGWSVERSRFDAQGPQLLVLSRNDARQQLVIRLIVDTP